MKKHEFISELRGAISALPTEEIEDRIVFYSEMIDDRIEEGCTEEEAVAAIGTVDAAADEILREFSLPRIVKEKIKNKIKDKKFTAAEITLLAVGSPIWVSILVALFVCAFSIYVSMWVVVVSFWASAFTLLVGGGVGGLLFGTITIFNTGVGAGLLIIGAAIASFGLAIFFYYMSKFMTNGMVALTKKTVAAVKRSFAKKGE